MYVKSVLNLYFDYTNNFCILGELKKNKAQNIQIYIMIKKMKPQNKKRLDMAIFIFMALGVSYFTIHILIWIWS